MNKLSPRATFLAGLFGFAIVWVVLMALVSLLSGGGAVGAEPNDDGTVNAKITSLDKGDKFLISMNMKVTDRTGKVLEGLGEQDIDVYEDGKPVSYKSFNSAGQGPVRLALVMDFSKSMDKENKIGEAKKAALEMLLLLREQTDYVGIYFFNDTLRENNKEEQLPVEPLDRRKLYKAWSAITFTGVGNGSPMTGTMQKALKSLEAVNGRRVMIVLTDGMETADDDGDKKKIEERKKELVDKSKDSNIPIFMINTSTDAEGEQDMKDLAQFDKYPERYIKVPKPDQLKEIFTGIGKSLQNEYSLTYISPTPVEDGQKRIVTAVVRNGKVGTKVKGDYTPKGILSAGAGGGGFFKRLLTLSLVFVSLAAGLAVLLGATYVVRSSAGAAEEAAAPATTPLAPRPVAPAPPNIQAKPSQPARKGSAKLG
jgi:VWFA-related protein